MESQIATTAEPSRRIGRSILALLAGFVVNVMLSLATDFSLAAKGILPSIGHGIMSNSNALLASAYRTFYCIISSYVVARLAPYSPVGHALIGAAIGMVLAALGAVATWNQNLGPHWYALSLIAIALPTAWIGGKLGARRDS